MPSATTTLTPKRVVSREIIRVQDVQTLYGCTQRTAYRIMERAKIKAGQLNAPLTVDQLSMYSGISRSRIKESM